MAVYVNGGGNGRERGGGASERPEASRARPSSPKAVSVTRLGQKPEGLEGGGEEWRFLVAGIDSLDVGFYVNWGERWEELFPELEDLKKEAEGTKGKLWNPVEGVTAIVGPSGKPPMYRFRVILPEANIFIGKSATPKNSPNVYVSFNAHALWLQGVGESVDVVRLFIEALGGTILLAKPSRIDLCADFLIPGGISLDFLKSHLVSQVGTTRHYANRERLESFYVANGSSPVQLRIYDKSLEVKKDGIKTWFYDIWGVENGEGVWRVEAQLRRQVLKEVGIKSVGDLGEKLAGLWRYVTESWASFRLNDDPRPTRRTVHPWWRDVQSCADLWGDGEALRRQYRSESLASTDWYVSHIAGCLTSYAARLAVEERDEALDCLSQAIRGRVSESDFEKQFVEKSIRIGNAASLEARKNE